MNLDSIGPSPLLSVPGVLGQPMNISGTPAEQRHAVAGQFEAILLRQFLNQSVTSMMGGDDSTQGSVYGYLLGDVLSQKLAAAGGLGLGKEIEQQLGPSGHPAAPAAGKGTS